jgi:hypothetical protein
MRDRARKRLEKRELARRKQTGQMPIVARSGITLLICYGVSVLPCVPWPAIRITRPHSLPYPIPNTLPLSLAVSRYPTQRAGPQPNPTWCCYCYYYLLLHAISILTCSDDFLPLRVCLCRSITPASATPSPTARPSRAFFIYPRHRRRLLPGALHVHYRHRFSPLQQSCSSTLIAP